MVRPYAISMLLLLTLAACDGGDDRRSLQVEIVAAAGVSGSSSAGVSGTSAASSSGGAAGQGATFGGTSAGGESGVAGSTAGTTSSPGGASGTDGTAGTAGVAGAAGSMGATGTAGTAGSGETGGNAGRAGNSGANGSAGSAANGASGGGGDGGVGGAGGTSGTSGGPSGAAGTTVGACPDDMVLAGDACMDRYEAPNVMGVAPLSFQTAYEGEDWCAMRGKRLCTDVEWNRACEGNESRAYPYGDTWVAHRCNDDKTWISPNWTALGTYPAQTALDEEDRLYQADPSGSRAECISQDGVLDLTGNVAEWVVRTIPNANNYDHVMKGCYWSKCYGGSNPSCGFVNPAHPGNFRTYEAGFRCCLTP